MKNKAAIIMLAVLAVPLALYFVPYTYAATSSSSYYVYQHFDIPGPATGTGTATCNTGDYATGGGYAQVGSESAVEDFYPIPEGVSGTTPTGYSLTVATSASGLIDFVVYAVCQTPITVAGIGIPEFGQLYLAIALGAVVFFLIARYNTGKSGERTSIPGTTLQ